VDALDALDALDRLMVDYVEREPLGGREGAEDFRQEAYAGLQQALSTAHTRGAEAMRRACVWAAKEAAAGYREDQAGAEAVLGAIEAMRPPGDPVAHRVASMAHEVSDHQAATAEALADALSALPVPEVGDDHA